MPKYAVVMTPEAEDDVANIRAWVRRSASQPVARNYAKRLLDHLAGFADAPHRGTIRDDLHRSIRTVGWRQAATIVFSVDTKRRRVVIHAVLHRGRDVAGVIADRLGDN